MRRIRQPGRAPAERGVAVPARGVAIAAELPAGRPLLEALHALVAAHGAEAAALSLTGGRLDPFGYVMPAASPDTAHAAWYSAPRDPAGGALWERGAVTVGWRGGAPFFHCHGIWLEADGVRAGGHVLPERAEIAAPMRVHGLGLVGARFVGADDDETGFHLFQPVAGEAVARPDVLALRLRPNQDITVALERLGRAAGFTRAHLAGGIGSTIGARFAGGRRVEPFATELFVTDAELDCRAGAGSASRVAVGLVDMTGALAEGPLVRGDNPILMTLEGVLTPR